MRALTATAGALLVLALGAVELTSMAFYGNLAQPPALPPLVPEGLGLVLARPLGSPAIPAVVRAAYARALLHRGATVTATAVVAGLPASAEAADLRGELAEDAGRPAAALEAFARAGDDERAQRLIDSGLTTRPAAQSVRLQAMLAGALDGAGEAGVRARALWRLGQLTQAQAVAEPARRRALQRAALDAYDAALALAPNEETYLLAAGEEALTIGDRAAAARYYQRALDAVPDSADARAGLLRARS